MVSPFRSSARRTSAHFLAHASSNSSDVGDIGNIDVDAHVQPAVLCRVRSGFDRLAEHSDNVLELARPIQQALRIGRQRVAEKKS